MSNSVEKFSPEIRACAVRLVLEHEDKHQAFVALAGDGVDCWQDRLFGAYIEQMGQESRG